MPEFFLAYVLVTLFAVGIYDGQGFQFGGLFPALSIVHEDLTFTQRLHMTALPALTLMLVILAHTMRMTRATIMGRDTPCL